MAKTQTPVRCKSVFKGGGSTTTKRRFTEKWVELVNLLEKSKRDMPVRR
ncbi:MAG: hypothetical protein Q4C72_00175 [Eubacteriales bacterium]|nr:hypothetical protein [Eubacteriales bacterium]